MNEQRQQILNSLPVTGEVTYEAFRTKLVQEGNETLLQHFHDMRRKGELKVRLDTSSGTAILYVARP